MRTTEDGTKPLPVMVIAPPAPNVRFWLESVDIVGTGLLTANPSAALDAVPLLALRVKEAADTSCAAGNTAVTCVALTKVVDSAVPLKETDVLLVKFDPASVITVSGEPAMTELGFTLVTIGAAAGVPTFDGGLLVPPADGLEPPPQPDITRTTDESRQMLALWTTDFGSSKGAPLFQIVAG